MEKMQNVGRDEKELGDCVYHWFELRRLRKGFRLL